MECIFCKIIENKIPSKKILENKNFIAILDAFPASEGHTLIIPKKHFENIFEIEEDILKESFILAQKIAKTIKNNLKIKDINILQNNGKNAGQTVNHFHIHIIPRSENDLVTIKSEVVDIKENRLKDIFKILSKDLI